MYQKCSSNTIEKITNYLDANTNIKIIEMFTNELLYSGKNCNKPKYFNNKSVYNVDISENKMIIQIFNTAKNFKTIKITRKIEVNK